MLTQAMRFYFSTVKKSICISLYYISSGVSQKIFWMTCSYSLVFSEAYLEPSRTSTIELFLSKYLTANICYFCRKSSIVDVRLGSNYFSGSVQQLFLKLRKTSRKFFPSRFSLLFVLEFSRTVIFL